MIHMYGQRWLLDCLDLHMKIGCRRKLMVALKVFVWRCRRKFRKPKLEPPNFAFLPMHGNPKCAWGAAMWQFTWTGSIQVGRLRAYVVECEKPSHLGLVKTTACLEAVGLSPGDLSCGLSDHEGAIRKGFRLLTDGANPLPLVGCGCHCAQ